MLRCPDLTSAAPRAHARMSNVFLLAPVQEIDKAVKRGIYHVNNGARKKSRLALARQKLLIACGLYKPAATASMSSVDRA